jgi:hypothetical protein
LCANSAAWYLRDELASSGISWDTKSGAASLIDDWGWRHLIFKEKGEFPFRSNERSHKSNPA